MRLVQQVMTSSRRQIIWRCVVKSPHTHTHRQHCWSKCQAQNLSRRLGRATEVKLNSLTAEEACSFWSFLTLKFDASLPFFSPTSTSALWFLRRHTEEQIEPNNWQVFGPVWLTCLYYYSQVSEHVTFCSCKWKWSCGELEESLSCILLTLCL